MKCLQSRWIVSDPDELPGPIELAVSFTGTLERLGIPYLVDGSLAAAMKVDVFVAGNDPFNAERLRHRERVRVSADPASFINVDSAEHSVLRKLEWYRRGGEVSERQMRDVVAILRIQGTRLDRLRLETWAARLGVSDLLRRALAAAGLPAQ